MASRRLHLLIGAGLVVGTAGLAGSPGLRGGASASTTSGAIAFSPPSVADPIHTYGEPDILTTPNGHVYVSGPTGTGTQRSVWNASADGGHTYRLVDQGPPPNPLVGLAAPQPGGGDTELATDRNSKVYFADLYALTCLRTATTSNSGATTQSSVYPGGCAGVPGADRQWIQVFDPPGGVATQSAYKGPFPLSYMEYNNLGTANNTNTGSAQWTKSADGLAYSVASAGNEFGADGYPSLDQTTGKVLQAEYDGLGNIKLNIGTPDAAGNLSFLDEPGGTGLITVATGVQDNSGEAANFVVSSMDSARNLFVAWVGRSTNPAQRQTFVSVASAASGWKNWSAPVQVSSPPSQVGIFPWVKAGGPGRADVVWYGSDKLADPSVDAGQAWNVFMAQVVFPTTNNAYVGGAPSSVQQVKVTPHPMHYNAACLQGTACIAVQGNRNLADYFEVTIDSSGAAEIVYDDTSNGLCQTGFTPTGNQTVDHCGAPLVSVAHQSAGLGLFGSSVSGPSNASTSSISGPSGDALYPVIGGTNVPGLDVLSTSLSVSKGRLKVTEKVVDLSNPAATFAAVPGSTSLQYVTRWQMGNTLYFAQMERIGSTTSYFAGRSESIDLCSVSACNPHVITYPEPALANPPGDTHAESGAISCPSSPSASKPCSVTINVNLADVGSPSAALLEEVASYSFASSHPAGFITNPQAQEDNLPLEVDGVCCFNFQTP